MEIRQGLAERSEIAANFFKTFSYSESERIICQEMTLPFERTDLTLFRIDEITFEDEAPRHEALENVLASMRVPGINFVYLILGDKKGVEFYFGLSRDLYSPERTKFRIAELGENLKASLLGNFRGSHVSEITDGNELQKIMDRIKNSHDGAFLFGVPGVNKDEEKQSFQGVDRLANVMQGREFGLLILAKPIMEAESKEIERTLYEIYRKINFWSKTTIQNGINAGTSKNVGVSHSVTKSTTETSGESKSQSQNSSSGENDATTTSTGTNEADTTSNSTSDTKNKSKNESVNESRNKGESKTIGSNKGTSQSQSTRKGTSSGSSSNQSTSSTETSTSGQEGTSESTQKNTGTSYSSSKQVSSSDGSNTTSGTSHSTTKNTSETTTKSTNHSTGKSTSTSKNSSKSETTSSSETKNDGESISSGTSNGNSFEDIDKEAQEWMKYLDEVVFPRLDYGKGKGLFMVSTYLLASNPKDLLQLENNTRSIFAGESGNRVPLENLPINKTRRMALEAFQLPFGQMPDSSAELKEACFIRSHCCLPVKEKVNNKEQIVSRMFLGNWMSAKELAILSGIPQKEIVGMRLKEEVEFGLNLPSKTDSNDREISLGNLVQSGELTNIPVSILESELDRHIFIAGVTGSGKTTTSKKILLDSGLPFLVIEPAKTEYRSLKSTACKDLLVFTLGNDDIGPFRLNPFEFFKGETITGRVDMIRASIEAAFDMEAAIPQIIESAIYKSYEDYGWDVTTNENNNFSDPFADGVFAFPKLEDVIKNCSLVVEKQGFDLRLKSDYIGSINARLQGLMIGAKGQMLNCRRSLDFDELLDKRVVIELEGIRSGNEKSLIMGFILTNFLEAVRRRYELNKHTKHRHILLVEEAHRLLSRFSPGDSPNRKHGIETFADMLAEIRKYGESLIIADQIPNKLTPEVLKNTNIKIVHRLFAKDDKETIGSTMSLSEEQCNYLSSLQIGNAIMFSGNWPKAIQVAITYDERTKEVAVNEEEIQSSAYQLYARQYKRGVFDYTEILTEEPDINTLKECQRMSSTLFAEFKKLIVPAKVKIASEIENLCCMVQRFDMEKTLKPLCIRQWGGNESTKGKYETVCRILAAWIDGHVPEPNDFAALDKKEE